MSAHTYDIRDIPVLNDAVDLTAVAPLAKIDTTMFLPVPVAGPPDTAALQAALSAEVLKLADSLTADAVREIGTLLGERIGAQLRAQLPGLIEQLVSEHLPGATEEPDAPHG